MAALFRSRGLLIPGAMPPKTQLRPISTPSSGKSQWHPVSIEQGIVNIKGGYNARGEAGQSIQYQVDDTIHVFVELDKNASWFLKGVGGSKVQKGDLKPVQVMNLLRSRFQQKLDDDPDAQATDAGNQLSAVAGSQSESQEPEEDVDPMDSMDTLDEIAPQADKMNQFKKRKLCKIKNSKSFIENIEVPTRPECVGCGNDDKTVVCVYQKAQAKNRGIGKIYLRADCIQWLLAYAADELHLHGVQQPTSEPIDALGGNCPAVADLRLEWDFTAKAWDAKFVAGALAGRTKRMCLNELDKNMWAKLRGQSLVNEDFGHASTLQKKQGLKELMQLWCAACARNETAAFEATMHWPANSTPQRGEKRDSEDMADDGDLAAADGDSAVAALFLDDADATLECEG